MDKRTESIEHLAAHALLTLPDSKQASRLLLEHIVAVLPKGSEPRLSAQAHLELHAMQDAQQETFKLEWNGGKS